MELAFELLTEGFEFDIERLYVTVYRGSEELGLPPDDISAAAWARAGIPRDHIVYLGDEDNFWSAGDTGPCGPCTEVFYDTGSEHGPAYHPGGEFDTTGRYIEIWNAGVFMEFNRQPGGTLEPLRFTSVDTGSGLERMAMVLQGCDSVYETDLFRPIVAAAQAALASGDPSPRDVRQIADHVRAAVLILGEGVVPSNEGRGYIPRRLLRTAIATATQAGADDFDLDQVARAALALLEPSYPQLASRREQVLDLLTREQRDFGRVVRRGLAQLNALAASPDFEISGEDAFTLVATHGLPADLIRDFAARRGGRVDERRFAELFAEHQQLSRPAARPGTGPGPDRGGDRPRADRGGRGRADRVPGLPAAQRGRPGAGPDRGPRARRAARAGRRAGRGRARAGGARPDPVLRRGRRPGRRHRPAHRPRRRGRGARHAEHRRALRAPHRGHQRDAEHRRRGAARGGSGAPPGHHAQPLGHPPAARGAAPGARRARAAGRVAGRPGPAAIRLRAPQRAHRRSRPTRSSGWSTRGCWRTPGAPRGSARSPRRSAAGPSRSSATSTARTCGWCRSATSRPSCAAARTCPPPPRSGCSGSSARAASAPGYAGSRR